MFNFRKKSSGRVSSAPDLAAVENFLDRGVENVFPSRDFLLSKMTKGDKMKVYFGIDPTGPTLHLGHLIPLKKLGILQRLGHKVVLLIGDFTAMIGDPTDKTAVRKKLSKEEVKSNYALYMKQASKFISFSGSNKAEVVYNSSWLGKMSFADVLELASMMTVDQMLKRDMFVERSREGKPIYIHEFLYPLMQGYDTVALEADGEIGGNDQTFNMLAGRDLLKSIKGKEKFVIATKLLTDPTGKKMGKSENNMVALSNSPEDVYGKVMSWPDGMILPAFEIVTDVSFSEIESMRLAMEAGENPIFFKARLAKEIVSLCHSAKEAEIADKSFEKTFSEGGIPSNIPTLEVAPTSALADIFIAEGLVQSKTEWRRLVDDEAVTLMEKNRKVSEYGVTVENGTYKIGKRRFIKLKVL